MDLPTYTSIWRIEKRLYKLYDFRLPMPIPVGQIAVFTAFAVPYVVILKLAGLPFSHTLLWLYVLPPGVAAWLVSRPVLEGKRLPELVVSQVRYLWEPRTWCRMAPLREAEHVVVVARVWRRARAVPAPARQRAGRQEPNLASRPAVARLERIAPPRRGQLQPAAPRRTAAQLATSAAAHPPRRASAQLTTAPAAKPPAAKPAAPQPPEAATAQPAKAAPAQPAKAAAPRPAAAHQAPAQAPPVQPVVTVAGNVAAEQPLALVERTLRRSVDRRAGGWHQPAVLAPGGHRPGAPDQLQRDRARARLKLTAGHRVVVLGCTVGAGQTVTALMIGELLASLRADRVAVLDLNPGTGSLAERALTVPPLTGSRAPAALRLEVFTREAAAAAVREADTEEAARIFELLSARYPLTLADPGPALVPRVLGTASQLVLVAPASADAAAALAATREWLEAHGHTGLAEAAITVLNGVSKHTIGHVEQAEALARGRTRAIVRIPWDDRLKRQDPQRSRPPASGASRPVPAPLSPAALHAYTALAGLLVASVATAPVSTAHGDTAPGITGPVAEKLRARP